MALISRIRNNSWLLITVIGFALAAFVLMDMTSSGNRQAAGDFTLGTVNGEAIDYKDFQRSETALYTGGGNTFANRNYLWNYYVEKTLVGQYAEELGIGVSRDELMELQFGQNLSPIITQRFSNQQTGQVDRQTLNNMRQRIESGEIDPSQRSYWSVQEKEIISNRKQSKINAMVAKALYTPSWMAEIRNTEQKATANFDYVKIPFTAVNDSDVEVTDADISSYVSANPVTFKQNEETRVAEYITFDVFPTKQDTMDIYDKMMERKAKMAAAENDSVFAQNNRGIYNATYFKADQIPPALKDTAMSLEIGSLYGPYLTNGQYQVIKVLDRKVIPDSVQSRHILRQVQTQEQFVVANDLIDSLKREIEAGTTTFEKAAQRFGTDGTKTSGGDLGYSAPGRMVKEFDDLIFYKAEEGKLYKIATQFGLHLVEVTDRKFETNEEGVQFSLIFENIKPSQETQNAEYDRIFDLISQNTGLENLRQVGELSVTPPIKQNDFTFPELDQSSTSREIVRWLFTPGIKTGETSPDVYIYKDPNLFHNSKYILVGLSEVNDGDLPGVSAVRGQVGPLVRNEKKAKKIISDLGSTDMNAAATQYGVEVQQATNVGLASGFVPGMGNEPEVLGQAFGLQNGETLGPIAGKDGVYYIRMGEKVAAPPVADIAASKKLFSSISKREVNTKLWPAVREESEISDNRYTYY